MNTNKKYHDLLVQQIKDAGQEIINRAETMVHPDLGLITDFYITISFSQENFPEISFSTSVINETYRERLRKKEVDICVLEKEKTQKIS